MERQRREGENEGFYWVWWEFDKCKREDEKQRLEIWLDEEKKPRAWVYMNKNYTVRGREFGVGIAETVTVPLLWILEGTVRSLNCRQVSFYIYRVQTNTRVEVSVNVELFSTSRVKSAHLTPRPDFNKKASLELIWLVMLETRKNK